MNNPYYTDPRQPFPIRHFGRPSADPSGQYVPPPALAANSGAGVPAALTQSSGYYPFYRDMIANTLTDRNMGPQDFPSIPDAALTTPVMDTDTVFEAARPYQVGDTSAYSPSADEHGRLYHQPPQRMLLAGVDVPENANADDSMIDQVPPTVPQIDQTTPAAAPALAAESGPPSTQQSRGVLTGNARGSDLPNLKIGRNEALMRIGGAIMGGASEGGLAAMQAGTKAYGAIQDANRQADADVFAIEEARRQSIADRMLKQDLASAKSKDIEQNAKALMSLQNADAVLKGFDDYDNVTGMGYWFAQKWDQLTGNERENIRLKINSMKVDRVLANIAQTKGAISEKEMDIFMSDQPAWTAGEGIWRKWVTDYRNALLVMHTNLANGTTVAPSGGGQASAVVFDPATGKFSDEK